MEPEGDYIVKALPAPESRAGTETGPERLRREYERAVMRLAYVLGMPSRLVDAGEESDIRTAMTSRGPGMASELLRRACRLGLEFRIWTLRGDPITLHWLLATALQHAFWALGWLEGRPLAQTERPLEWFRGLDAADANLESLLMAASEAEAHFDRAQAVSEFLLHLASARLESEPGAEPASELDELRGFHVNPIAVRPEPYKPAKVRQNFEAIAAGLAGTYSQIPEVEAMAVINSAAEGLADTWSDLNLILFTRGHPTPAQRRLALSGVSDPESAVVQTPESDCLVVRNLLVNVTLTHAEAQQSWLDAGAGGGIGPGRHVQGIDALIHGKPVFDRNGIFQSWRQRARELFDERKGRWREAELEKFKEYASTLQLAAEARDPLGAFMASALAAAALARLAMLIKGFPPRERGPLWARNNLDRLFADTGRQLGAELAETLTDINLDPRTRRTLLQDLVTQVL